MKNWWMVSNKNNISYSKWMHTPFAWTSVGKSQTLGKIGFNQLQLKFQMHNFHSRKSLVSTNKQYKKNCFYLYFFDSFFLFAFMLVTRFNFYLSPSLERERYYGGKKVALIKYSFDLIYGHLTQKQDYNFCVSLLLIFICV